VGLDPSKNFTGYSNRLFSNFCSLLVTWLSLRCFMGRNVELVGFTIHTSQVTNHSRHTGNGTIWHMRYDFLCSIVTMTISCILSLIMRDTGQISQFFH